MSRAKLSQLPPLGIGLTDTEYQALAGSAFTLVFTVCGVAFGTIGDSSNRIMLLSISLMLWSVATLCAGFLRRLYRWQLQELSLEQHRPVAHLWPQAY